MKTRREFLIRTTQGLAVLGTGGLLLRADAQATPKSGEVGSYGAYLPAPSPRKMAPSNGEWTATEDNIKGPFHRDGAPYRPLVTQLYFAGDKYNRLDPFIKKTLIIPLSARRAAGGKYREGTFDIVLAPA